MTRIKEGRGTKHKHTSEEKLLIYTIEEEELNKESPINLTGLCVASEQKRRRSKIRLIGENELEQPL